ncbi:exodeoxyribonuclease X [Pseudonocardia kunmingensis]|uniref:Exodeoxyribonuclease X n=1 Tax=Pseudonocardia kunmingensis TaxID=630975 RepID=A0A543D9Q8_9PSEU|nr:exodeoxyribonuclease X [Pseudonocardia kunmingensis]
MPQLPMLTFPWRPSTPGQDVVVVDVEGNGQQPPEIIEIALLPLTSGGIATPAQLRTWLIQPENPINPVVTRKVHGIDDDDVAEAPRWGQVAGEIADELQGRVLVAHNAAVERRVLGAHLPDWRPPLVVDTQRLAKTAWPGLPGGYGLDNLITHAALDPPDTTGLPPRVAAGMARHRAPYDVWMTAALFAHLVTHAGLSPEQLLHAGRLPDPPLRRAAGADPTNTEDGLW